MDNALIDKYTDQLKAMCEHQRAKGLFDNDISKIFSLAIQHQLASVQEILILVLKELQKSTPVEMDLKIVKEDHPPPPDPPSKRIIKEDIQFGKKEDPPAKEATPEKEKSTVIKKFIKKPQKKKGAKK